jgi:signal transduction histidine kinase/ligand-binding sensor domain-containing protein
VLTAVLLLHLVAETGVSAIGNGERLTHASEYVIEPWQVEQGLPHISVTSIAQTPDGYLWVGTFNGLARFDGVRFSVFNDRNTPALGNSAITHLAVDDRGALWIVTLGGGLIRMVDGQFTSVLKDDARYLLAGADPSEDSGRRLVLIDRNGGSHPIEDALARSPERPERDGSDDAPRLLLENGFYPWVAQRGRINRSDQTTFPVSLGEGTNRHDLALTVTAAAPSRTGGYWIATSNGVYRLRQGRLSSVSPVSHGLIKEDGEGQLWAGDWGEGLFRLNADGSWQRFSIGTGLEDSHVSCLFLDREGCLWVGTGQGGLHRIRRRVFQMYHTATGPDVIMSVTQDQQGRMWFGVNGGGLHTLGAGTLTPTTEPASFRANLLTYSVLADRRGAVWVGLYGKGALHWQAEGVTPHDLGSGPLREMTPHALFEDAHGTVWLGCTRGLLRYEHDRFTRFASGEGLSCETVVALAGDRAGTLYVGTDGGGLNCLREGRFTCFTTREGLGDDHVASLYVDEADAVWIGTANGGLSRLKAGRLTTVGVKDGLPTDTIGTVLEDDLGNLWLGSNSGIVRVSRQALNEYLEGERDSVAWRVFGRSDGLSTLGCVSASQPASCKARDGRLWFSTIKGVAVVDPSHIPFNPLPPSVVIEEVVLDGKSAASSRWSAGENPPEGGQGSVPATQQRATTGPGRPANGPSPGVTPAFASLTVPPGTRRVDFRFTGLSLVAPEEVRFRYRLETSDRDWVEAGPRRTAYYTMIPPGRYLFRVLACNNDGVWNDAGASLRLHVLPPWWMTWWFRGLVVLGVGGSVFGWYEGRLHRLRREQTAQATFARQLISSQESERQRIAGELHDGLGQDLLIITNQAQFGLSQEVNPPATVARLKEISGAAVQALQQVRRISHNLRPALLDELGFTKATAAMIGRAGQSAALRVAVQLEEVDGLLPAEFEINLFRIVQESLNNILKHAGASEARVALTRTPRRLRLEIQDNGRGFDPARSSAPGGRGLGLRQIAERAKIMGARLDVQSQPGQGTRLTLEIPLPGKG